MTSSETGSAKSATVRFPPRAQLPPGIVIPSLPALGTTWYERGISYWARRAGMFLILVVGVAIYVAIISGIVHAAGPAGSPGFIAVLTAEAVFTLVSGVLLIRHFWRVGVSGQLTNAKPGRNRRAGGAGLGLLAASAGPVGAFLIVASALLSAGFVLAATVTSLFPVTPAEQSVRRQLAEALQQNRQGHS